MKDKKEAPVKRVKLSPLEKRGALCRKKCAYFPGECSGERCKYGEPCGRFVYAWRE